MDNRHPFPGLWPGLIFMSIGGGLLAREFGYLPANVRLVSFWPLVPIFIGIGSFVHGRGLLGRFFSLAFVAMGGVLLAGNLGFIAFPAARLWPGLLILLGISILVRGGRGPHWHGPGSHGRRGRRLGARDWSGQVPDQGSDQGPHHETQTSADDRINKQFTFSGAQVRIESRAWKGGELGVTAGGVELDLRYAELAPEGAVLDVRVVMGGADIRVPDTWQVHSEVTPLFGGADDTTRSTQGSLTAPRLRVIGSVTLGGVTIRN